jgi:hypothetical protein
MRHHVFREAAVRSVTKLLLFSAIGATAMYLLDPVQGHRRRALARDRATRMGRKTRRFLTAAGVDIRNRFEGLRARMRQARWNETREHDALLERVRAAIGRVVSHPGAIHTMIVDEDGVRLDGAILRDELAGLIAAIRRIEGVASIDNRLVVRRSAEHIPGLQGQGTPKRHRIRHALRAPGIRAAIGTAAVVSTVAGLSRLRTRGVH